MKKSKVRKDRRHKTELRHTKRKEEKEGKTSAAAAETGLPTVRDVGFPFDSLSPAWHQHEAWQCETSGTICLLGLRCASFPFVTCLWRTGKDCVS
ncbi:Hypothetical predicted protein [Podarcis lilfordi]|uniref:Uncharacterized protein n=1 Tax=Podarcis lilfordi TaxID=74358 RepID=A0AA35PJH3_9SAUR|nr:Hypothetical predicted protein [Podarcis lilfordi]